MSMVMVAQSLLFVAAVTVVCALAGPIAARLGVLDHPDGVRKAHSRPTPLLGGLALMPPLILIAVAGIALHPDRWSVFAALAVAGTLFLIVGFLDDRSGLPARGRLLGAFAICFLIMLYEPSLVLRALDFGPLFAVVPLGAAAIPFTLLCVVGFQNALNMADGRNGLVLALTVFWLLNLSVYAPAHLLPYLGLFLAGALIVLAHNWRGRLFLGDAGSRSIGAVLALAMVLVYNTTPAELRALTFVLWLLIPVVDCLRLMAKRPLLGRSPFDPDTDHLHHRLNRIWPWPKAFAIYLALVAVPGSLDLVLMDEATFFLILLTLAAYGLLLYHTRLAPAAVQAAE